MKNHGILFTALLFGAGCLLASTSFAHCDTKDGPVVASAIKAMEQNNINYALIWVHPAYEKEVKEAFDLTMKVRGLGIDARKLADNYFFETLVRLHRTGEGVAYTGVKPAGTLVDEKILAADKSIAVGNLSPLYTVTPESKHKELKRLFDKVMTLKDFDVNDVPAGRKYIEAYVQFFHFAEGEGEHAGNKKGEHPHE